MSMFDSQTLGGYPALCTPHFWQARRDRGGMVFHFRKVPVPSDHSSRPLISRYSTSGSSGLMEPQLELKKRLVE
jgi:hypothetical protein